MADKIREEIDGQIKAYRVFVIAKTYCSFCTTAMKVLNKYDIPDDFMMVRYIDGDPKCDMIQDYMSILTGARTVPRVFIGGRFVGGGNDICKLHQQKKLTGILKAAGAID